MVVQNAPNKDGLRQGIFEKFPSLPSCKDLI